MKTKNYCLLLFLIPLLAWGQKSPGRSADTLKSLEDSSRKAKPDFSLSQRRKYYMILDTDTHYGYAWRKESLFQLPHQGGSNCIRHRTLRFNRKEFYPGSCANIGTAKNTKSDNPSETMVVLNNKGQR